MSAGDEKAEKKLCLLCGDHLFAAGTRDVLDPEDPLSTFEGREGALLQVFSTSDGSLVKSQPLKSLAAFDGLSAAGGRLYLAAGDGKVICFSRRVRDYPLDRTTGLVQPW